MGNGSGAGRTLVAVRTGWWLRPSHPLLAGGWLEFDATGRGYQALVLVDDADLPGLQRSWRRTQAMFPLLADDAELWASRQFLPLSGAHLNGWLHLPAPDLPRFDPTALEQAMAAAERRHQFAHPPVRPPHAGQQQQRHRGPVSTGAAMTNLTRSTRQKRRARPPAALN
jgi:hypothetical protein